MTCPPDPSTSSPGSHQPWWAARDPYAPRAHHSQMRIGNAERAQVTDDLCKHFSEGRLDESELEDRMAAAAAAKTQAELAPLLADLPPLGGPPDLATTRPPRRHLLLWAGVLVLLAPVLFAGMVAAGLGMLGMAHDAFHELFPLLLVAAAIVVLARRRGHRHHHHHLP